MFIGAATNFAKYEDFIALRSNKSKNLKIIKMGEESKLDVACGIDGDNTVDISRKRRRKRNTCRAGKRIEAKCKCTSSMQKIKTSLF